MSSNFRDMEADINFMTRKSAHTSQDQMLNLYPNVPYARISQTVRRGSDYDEDTLLSSHRDNTGGLLDRVINQPWQSHSFGMQSSQSGSNIQLTDLQEQENFNLNIAGLCNSPKLPSHIYQDSCRQRFNLEQLPHPTRLRKTMKEPKPTLSKSASDVTRHLQQLKNKRSLCVSDSLLERSCQADEPSSKRFCSAPTLSSNTVVKREQSVYKPWEMQQTTSERSDNQTGSQFHATWLDNTQDSSALESRIGSVTQEERSSLGRQPLVKAITNTVEIPAMCSTPKTRKYQAQMFPSLGRTAEAENHLGMMGIALRTKSYQDGGVCELQMPSEADLPPNIIDMASMWSNHTMYGQKPPAEMLLPHQTNHPRTMPRIFAANTDLDDDWNWQPHRNVTWTQSRITVPSPILEQPELEYETTPSADDYKGSKNNSFVHSNIVDSLENVVEGGVTVVEIVDSGVEKPHENSSGKITGSDVHALTENTTEE